MSPNKLKRVSLKKSDVGLDVDREGKFNVLPFDSPPVIRILSLQESKITFTLELVWIFDFPQALDDVFSLSR